MLQILGPKATEALPGAKAFTSFVMTLVKIEEHCHAVLQWKCKANEVCLPLIPLLLSPIHISITQKHWIKDQDVVMLSPSSAASSKQKANVSLVPDQQFDLLI